RFWRLTVYPSDLASSDKEPAPGGLDRGLSDRDIGRIGGLIGDLDFSDGVDRRIGLGMKSLNRDRAKAEAGKHRQCNGVMGFHDDLLRARAQLALTLVSMADRRFKWGP